MIVRLILASGLIVVAATGAQAQENKPWRLDTALDTPDWLSLSGSSRIRYEGLGGQFRPGGIGGDQLLALRTSILAQIKLDNVKLVGELIDSRTYLADSGTTLSTSSVNTFEPVQVYIAASVNNIFIDGAKTDFRFGRFTLDLGSGRLLARNKFRNTTNAFTGFEAGWSAPSGQKLTVFYTLPQQILPSNRASLLDNETETDAERFARRFWGAYYTQPGLLPNVTGEFYIFGLNENDDGSFQTANRNIYTLGLRLYRPAKKGAADFEFETAYQFGTRRASSKSTDVTDLDVRAWMLHAEAGYTFEAPWTPHLTVQIDYASGEGNKTDKTYNGFDSLFEPNSTYWSFTGINGPLSRSNIVSPGIRLDVKPSNRWDGYVSYRALWLADARGAFGVTGVIDPTGSSGTFAGHNLVGRVRYWLIPDSVRLDFGGAVLFDGEFLRKAPNAAHQGDTVYGYTAVEFSF